MLAGASIDAARRIIAEDCSAFNIGGGLHHALPTVASGFVSLMIQPWPSGF